MTSKRWGVEEALAIGTALVMLVVLVWGGAIFWNWYRSAIPVHEDAASVPSTAAAVPSDRYARAVEESRQLARALTIDGNLPGLSVAVAVDGEVVWAEGFGWSDAESRTPITPRTRFRLGALSRPLTAFGAALLSDRDNLDLDAPIQRYVPAYPEKQWTVTTRQLMGDVAGVHRIRGDNNDAMPTEHCESVGEAVALLAGEPIMFEPATQHRYSVWGWVLVSAVVEGAAAEPFARFMSRQVFEPLGMTRTVAAETEGLEDVAHGAGRGPDYSCVAGGGAFLSTPTDLVRFGTTMLKPGRLKSETIAAVQTPGRLTSGASTTYALGWTVTSVEIDGAPVGMISHRGSPTGGSVSLLAFPGRGLAVAAAANRADARGVDPFARQVAVAFTRTHAR